MSDNTWRSMITPRTWLEAVIEGEGGTENGVVETIQLNGLFVRVLGNFFLTGEKVRIDLYLRDQDKRRHPLVTLQARVCQADKRQAFLRFRPMTLDDQGKVRDIIDCLPPSRDWDRNLQEGILIEERFGIRMR